MKENVSLLLRKIGPECIHVKRHLFCLVLHFERERERERALAARDALFLSGNFGFLYEKQLGDTRAMWYIVNGDKSSHVMDRITSLYNNNRVRYLWVASHPLKQKDAPNWFLVSEILFNHTPHPYLHLLSFIQYGTFLSWGISLSSPTLIFCHISHLTHLSWNGIFYLPWTGFWNHQEVRKNLSILTN
jgi:hypothetical protein